MLPQELQWIPVPSPRTVVQILDDKKVLYIRIHSRF